MIFKTKIKQPKTAVSLENVVGNISCEYSTELMMSPYRLDTIIYIILYYIILYYIILYDIIYTASQLCITI